MFASLKDTNVDQLILKLTKALTVVLHTSTLVSTEHAPLCTVFMDTDAVLLIDADSAIKRINSTVALHHNQHTCPPMTSIIINFYCTSSHLFVTEGKKPSSEEGMTQGCPLFMALYAFSVVLLINQCHHTATSDCTAAMQCGSQIS